jgi:hypothetical protein
MSEPVHKATKAQLAEERRKNEARAIRARDCLGCPYAGCVGATATLSWDEMTARFRDEAGGTP